MTATATSNVPPATGYRRAVLKMIKLLMPSRHIFKVGRWQASKLAELAARPEYAASLKKPPEVLWTGSRDHVQWVEDQLIKVGFAFYFLRSVNQIAGSAGELGPDKEHVVYLVQWDPDANPDKVEEATDLLIDRLVEGRDYRTECIAGLKMARGAK